MYRISKLLFPVILIANIVYAEIIEVSSFDTDGTAYDVWVEGDLAYIADGQDGLRIIDILNPEEPEEVGSLDTDGSAFAIVLKGDLAYIADGQNGLIIVDVSWPLQPEIADEFSPDRSLFNDVKVVGDLVYVADLINGMRIINVADGENPNQVALFDTPDVAQGIFIEGDYAYIADRRSGLQIVDISNPEEPTEAGSIDTPGEANAVFVQDDFAYVADKTAGLRIIDVSDPTSPEEVGAFDTDGLAFDVCLNGHYAYIADGAEGFLAVNESDPENPGLVGGLDTDGTAYGVFADGEFVFMADGEAGLQIIQLTPEIVISDEELNFGEVEVGEAEELTLTIGNDGHDDLTISDVEVEGRYYSCDFEDDVTVGAGEEYELVVTFSPEWFGEFEGSLAIYSNDMENEIVSVELIGIGNILNDETKITAGDADEGDLFGISVSISGDYAIVGAYGNDDDGANSGSAYIFVPNGDDWI